MEKTLRSLEEDDVIKIVRDASGTAEFVELSDSERLCGRENYDFYCFLIWPFIEASWLGAVSLLGLTPPLNGSEDVWVDMKKAQDSAQLVSSLFQYLLSAMLTIELAWQNIISPRRFVLFRSGQQGDTQKLIPTLRGGGHHPCC